jgi:PAS domain S-box-containing protein
MNIDQLTSIFGDSKQDILRFLEAYDKANAVRPICSVTDLKGTILFVNEEFIKVTQYTRDEVIGKNHNIVKSGIQPKIFYDNLWETINNKLVWHGDLLNKAKDGTLYWVRSNIVPIFDTEGNTTHYLALQQLINKEKKAEADYKDYIESLNEIMGIISHRIRKPIVTLSGLIYLNEIIEDMPVEEIRKIIGHMKDSVNELDALTREMGDYVQYLDNKTNKDKKTNKD